MEGCSIGPPAQARKFFEREAGLLALLMVLSVVLHAWVIAHTTVAARDSIGFIRYAWRLEHEPAETVLRTSLHPPLYPATVLAMSLPVRRFSNAPESIAMQRSAQLACALAGVLLVIPMFYLGRELFGCKTAFWATLLFQCLPVSSRALSDGLTEGTYLLWTAMFLWLALGALKHGSPSRCGLCGLCGGLAYLTRPEGALLVLAGMVVLVGMQFLPAWRRHWGRTLACTVSLIGCALAIGAPYMWTIGGFTNKTSTLWIMQGSVRAHERASVQAGERGKARSVLADGARVSGAYFLALPCRLALSPSCASPLVSSCAPALWRFTVLADWVPGWTESKHSGSLWWGVRALLKGVSKCFHYVVWLPALLGLWWFRHRATQVPGVWLMALLCLVQTLLLLRLTVVAGYISDRHSLLFLLCGVYWAVAAVEQLGRRLSPRPALTTFLLLALTLYGLPSTLKTLHPSRIGFREAGFWLAQNADPSDDVVDPFCWSEFYAGRVFQEGLTHPVPRGHWHKRFAILDTSDHHSHQPLLPEAEKIREVGKLVYHWPTDRAAEKAAVLVYAVTLGQGQ